MTELSDRRDREVARTGGRRLPDVVITSKVVGVSFVPGYPDNITELAEIANRPTVDGPYFSEGDQAQLIHLYVELRLAEGLDQLDERYHL